MSDDPRSRAAAAMRRLGHTMMAREADDGLLLQVERAAHEVADLLEAQPRRQRDILELKQRLYLQPVEDGSDVSHFDECFVSGAWNPMGIAIDVRREGGDAVATVHLGHAFEGAPGRAHGGIVAAIFDDVLGYLLTLEQQPGFTGELTVRYLAPTPIDESLQFRGRVTGWEGRKMFTEGEARQQDGTVIATATGLFVTIDLDRIRE